MEEKHKYLQSRRRFLLPLFVLACGLAATGLATYLVNENLHFRDRQQLKEARHQVERTIQSRMEAHVALLRGGAGLFAANQRVTLQQFRHFHQRLEIDKRYPGLLGVGYSILLPPDKLDELEQSMQNQGLTNFHVWPQGPRDQFHSIVFLEPQNYRNQRALGFDMFTETHRRAAMEAARDRGEPHLTRKVELVQELEGEVKQPGFLLYLPLYFGGDIPQTVSDRRALLQGFIYSPFRAGDLLSGIAARVRISSVGFAIWDGTNVTRDSLLFQSDPRFDLNRVREFSRVEIAGVPWTLGVSELTGSGSRGNILWIVPLLGVIASLLLAYFTYTEGNARARSDLAAMELSNQREWLETTLGSIGDGVISTDTDGRIQFMNAAAEQLTSWRYADAYGKSLHEVFPITDEETGAPAENPCDRVLASGQVVTLANNTLLRDRNGIQHHVDDSAAPIRDRSGALVGVILVFREISARRQFERRSTTQHEVTRLLSESPALSEVASRVLETLCRNLQFDFAVFWQFDPDSGRAEAVHFSQRDPSRDFDHFRKTCAAYKPRKGESLPGIVWESMAPMWVKEFGDGPRFPRASGARAAGLRAALAFPIQGDNILFGALEFFTCTSEEPDQELLKVVGAIGAQVGQFIQRKRAEQALGESEALHRAISETAPDGIVVIDQQSRIVTVNTAMEQIFGYPLDELVGYSLKKLLPPRIHATHDRAMRHFFEAEQKQSPWLGTEVPGLHRDGTEIPLEISFGVAKRSDGYLFTGFIRDIRRRKESERQLRETEERFSLLIRLAEEYAIIIKGPDGRITAWNPGAQRIFGYSDEEVIGRDSSIFYTPEDRAAGIPEKQLRRSEAEGQVNDERWQVRKDGSRFWMSGSVVCLRDVDGTVRGFAKILRDITERKQAEEAIRELNQELETRVQRRTAALQESKEQMEAFSYTVAHDLRAPLRSMQGFAYALMDEYQSKLGPDALEFLNRIMRSAERMDALIQDLLEYSRLSGSDLTFRAVSVPETVQFALQRLELDIRRANADVRVNMEPLYVKAHPATFENALSNLVANAIKFAHPGVPPRITIRAIDQGAFVQISVQDNGIGIAPEHHSRIFGVFERLHAEHNSPGTGIGLAIVKKGVERMGGRVGVTSERGEGSLFWIELPKADLE